MTAQAVNGNPAVTPFSEPVFVFSSTLSGAHDKGAGALAVKYHGAQAGKASGPVGNSYAIPVWNTDGFPLPFSVIKNYVEAFLAYAGKNPALRFQVSRIGCEDAGQSDAQMVALFKRPPENCMLPGVWLRVLDPQATLRIIVLDPNAMLKTPEVQRRLDDYFSLNLPLWGASGVEIVSVGPAASIVANDAYARARGYLHRISSENRDYYGADAAAMRDAKAAWYASHLLCISDPDSTSNRAQVRLVTVATRNALSVDDINLQVV